MIMKAAKRVGRKASSALVRRWFRQGADGEARVIALRAAIDLAMSADVRPLINFLNALYLADEVTAEDIGSKLIDDPADFHRFHTLVRNSPSDLSQIIQLLLAAKSCDLRFGTKISEQYANTSEYEEKWQGIVNIDSPLLHVRLIACLEGLNRRLFISARDKYLSDNVVLVWAERMQEIGPFVDFLSQLRRVRPKAASRALGHIVERRKSTLGTLIESTDIANQHHSLAKSRALIDESRVNSPTIASRLCRGRSKLSPTTKILRWGWEGFSGALQPI